MLDKQIDHFLCIMWTFSLVMWYIEECEGRKSQKHWHIQIANMSNLTISPSHQLGILWSRPLDGSYQRSARCFGGCSLRRPRGDVFLINHGLTEKWKSSGYFWEIFGRIFAWFLWCFFSPAPCSDSSLQVKSVLPASLAPTGPLCVAWMSCFPKAILRTFDFLSWEHPSAETTRIKKKTQNPTHLQSKSKFFA